MKKLYRNQNKRVDEDKDIEQVEIQEEETIDSTDEVVEDVPVVDEAEQIDDVQATEPEEVEDDEDIEEREAEQDEEPAQATEPIDEAVEEPEQVDEHIIEGYAIVFNELSEDLGGFREIIEPSAINEELINNSDIYYLFNHNSESIPLARSNRGTGSLKLSIDDKGLKYNFNCLNSEFYQIVQRGDLDKSSFAFSLPENGEGEKWEKSNEYNYIRRITKIDRLYDCSAVLVPAYSQTSVYARSNDKQKEVDSNYYNKYENIIDSLLQ